MRFVQRNFCLISMALILVIPALLLAACTPAPTTTFTSPATTVSNPAKTTETTAAPTTAVPGTTAPTMLSGAFSEEDLALAIGGQSFTLYDDAAALLKILGDDCQKTEAESCVFDGLDKTFDYGYLQVYTIPKGEQDLIDGIYIMDASLQTARGIRVGDSQDSVIAAYGEKIGEGSLIYNQSGDPDKLDEPSLTFVFDGNLVSAISYYSGSNNQGTGSGY